MKGSARGFWICPLCEAEYVKPWIEWLRMVANFRSKIAVGSLRREFLEPRIAQIDANKFWKHFVDLVPLRLECNPDSIEVNGREVIFFISREGTETRRVNILLQ